jgi:hypothetical protein
MVPADVFLLPISGLVVLARHVHNFQPTIKCRSLDRYPRLSVMTNVIGCAGFVLALSLAADSAALPPEPKIPNRKPDY